MTLADLVFTSIDKHMLQYLFYNNAILYGNPEFIYRLLYAI